MLNYEAILKDEYFAYQNVSLLNRLMLQTLDWFLRVMLLAWLLCWSHARTVARSLSASVTMWTMSIQTQTFVKIHPSSQIIHRSVPVNWNVMLLHIYLLMMVKNTSPEQCGCINYKIKEFLLLVLSNLSSLSLNQIDFPIFLCIFSSLNIVKNIFFIVMGLGPN